MNREEVNSKLALISPCLGKQDFVEVLTHVCFTNGDAIAFNGTQAAVIEMDLDFDCTVPGGLLQKLVGSYSTAEIGLEESDGKLVISSGKSVAKLNTFSSSDYVFDASDIGDGSATLEIDEDFVNGISKCLISVSDNFIDKSQSGITLDASKEGVYLYSTDDTCISKYVTSQKCEKSGKVVLPKLFCNQLIAWQRALGNGMLSIGLDYITADFDDGASVLFSKVDAEVDYLDFEDVIAQSYFEDTEVVPVPEKLKEVLQRCNLITSGSPEQFVTVQLGSEGAVLTSESRNKVHKITDTIELLKVDEDSTFVMDSNLLSRGLDCVDEMAFSSESPADLDTVLFIGKSNNFLHLINSK